MNEISKFNKKIALTIGNFEGFHIGHQKIVKTLKNEAKKRNLLTCILTFKNHPLKLLKGYEPERLWSRCDKIITFDREGIDLLVYLNFSKEFAYQEPEEFLSLLKVSIDPSLICLGETFRFGRENRGDIDIIKKYSRNYGWEFLPIKDLEMFGEKVSSTQIRKKIKYGDFKTANSMLGRKYSIYLKPIKDRKNSMRVFIENTAVPEKGIFPVEIIDLKQKDYYATTVKLENGIIEMLDLDISGRESLYSLNFDTRLVIK